MTDKPFGIDISGWQRQVDWDTVAAHVPKVHFAFMRSSISLSADTWFTRNWSEAKRVGILRGAYHYVDFEADVNAQMGKFISMLGDDYGELPRVLDCECDEGKTAGEITSYILTCSDIIANRTGRRPIIYSRAEWLNNHTIAVRLAGHDFWLAQYLTLGTEHPGPPTLPKGIDRARVVCHQTADHTPGFGVETAMLDYDRWQYDLAHLYSYAGQAQPAPVPDPEPPVPAPGKRKFKVDARSGMRKREQPNIYARIMGTLAYGATYEAESVVSNGIDRWARLNDGSYVCIDTTYCREV